MGKECVTEGGDEGCRVGINIVRRGLEGEKHGKEGKGGCEIEAVKKWKTNGRVHGEEIRFRREKQIYRNRNM